MIWKISGHVTECYDDVMRILPHQSKPVVISFSRPPSNLQSTNNQSSSIINNSSSSNEKKQIISISSEDIQQSSSQSSNNNNNTPSSSLNDAFISEKQLASSLPINHLILAVHGIGEVMWSNFSNNFPSFAKVFQFMFFGFSH